MINNLVGWMNSIVVSPVSTVFGVLLIIFFVGFMLGVIIGRQGWR